MDKKSMDECLVAMQRFGSESAFEQLYNESKKGVFSFIYAYVPNFHDAEDILQQTFINVRKYISSYSAGSNPTAWLLQIAKNNCLNFIKKKNHEVVFTDCETQMLSLTIQPPEVSGQLLNIINESLNKQERRIVMLYLVTGLKHREIAKELNMPLGTVLWKYNKAIKTLQVEIKKEYYEV